jgi:hypothetical protein
VMEGERAGVDLRVSPLLRGSLCSGEPVSR